MDLTDKDELLQYLKSNNLWAKKGLSQNFLINRGSLDAIIGAAEIKDDDLIIEVGPGLGTLTDELVLRAGEVVSVELDSSLADLLRQKFSIFNFQFSKNDQVNNLKIINSDVLKVNFSEVVEDSKYKVVANIPYHITSKIVRLFLEQRNRPELMVLLVQKEVAERICAKPGEMSVLAISVQYYGEPELVEVVKKECFFPSPKVDSAILKISHIKSEAVDKEGEKRFFRLVNIGFASRRKTLLNNLSVGYHIDRKIVSDILKVAGLSDNSRAQELSVEKWKELLKQF